jgi:hypothetical protein
VKLSIFEKQRINLFALHHAYRKGLITYQEFSFYLLLRECAFPNKKGERGISMIQVHQIVKEFGYPKKRVEIILKSLEKKKMLKPHYYIKTKDGLTSYTDISVFDGENGLGRRRIKFTKWEVLLVPGESKLRKSAKKLKID